MNEISQIIKALILIRWLCTCNVFLALHASDVRMKKKFFIQEKNYSFHLKPPQLITDIILKKIIWGATMEGLISLMISGIFIIVTVGYVRSNLQRKQAQASQECRKAVNDAEYLYKIARLAKTSEYEVFEKTAENWPVSKAAIDEDFRKYLDSQTAPYYVSHYIRENKQHLDEIRMPYLWQ